MRNPGSTIEFRFQVSCPPQQHHTDNCVVLVCLYACLPTSCAACVFVYVFASHGVVRACVYACLSHIVWCVCVCMCVFTSHCVVCTCVYACLPHIVWCVRVCMRVYLTLCGMCVFVCVFTSHCCTADLPSWLGSRPARLPRFTSRLKYPE